MQLSREELNNEHMPVVFFLRFILCILAVANIIYSIYWITLTSNSTWADAIGNDILVSSIFNVIFAIGSLVLMIFCIVGFLSDNPLIGQVYIAVTILCFTTSFILLSLSSETSRNKYVHDLTDYCQRLGTTNSICTANNTRWSITNFVRTRVTEPYDIFVGLLSPWIVCFAIFVVMCSTINSKRGNKNKQKKKRRGKESLNTQENQESAHETLLQNEEQSSKHFQNPSNSAHHEELLQIDVEEESYYYDDFEEDEEEEHIQVEVDYQTKSMLEQEAPQSIRVDDTV